jgi:hypothetical protein
MPALVLVAGPDELVPTGGHIFLLSGVKSVETGRVNRMLNFGFLPFLEV